MNRYILIVIFIFVIFSVAMRNGDASQYEQKPHLELKCPCGASFVTYEWLNEYVFKRVEKFIETHKCSHDTRIEKKQINLEGKISKSIETNIEEITKNKIYEFGTSTVIGKKEIYEGRLIVREMIGSETMRTIYSNDTKYSCIRCGRKLRLCPVGYYCASCQTGFDIKEE